MQIYCAAVRLQINQNRLVGSSSSSWRRGDNQHQLDRFVSLVLIDAVWQVDCEHTSESLSVSLSLSLSLFSSLTQTQTHGPMVRRMQIDCMAWELDLKETETETETETDGQTD